jgi:predicted ester cyclase
MASRCRSRRGRARLTWIGTTPDDVVWHGGILGDIAVAGNVGGLLSAFIGALPDLYAAEQDIVAENDLVMVRLVVKATQKGALLGVPASGTAIQWNAVDIYRIRDGRISEELAADDIAAIMNQDDRGRGSPSSRGAFRYRLRKPGPNGSRLPGRDDHRRWNVFRGCAARLDHDPR